MHCAHTSIRWFGNLHIWPLGKYETKGPLNVPTSTIERHTIMKQSTMLELYMPDVFHEKKVQNELVYVSNNMTRFIVLMLL